MTTIVVVVVAVIDHCTSLDCLPSNNGLSRWELLPLHTSDIYKPCIVRNHSCVNLNQIPA